MPADGRDERRLVEFLRRVGVHISSVYDLVNTTRKYPEAIPALCLHLSQIKDRGIKEGVVRALGVPEARGLAGPTLVREFRALPFEAAELDHDQMIKWAIANALVSVADADVLDDLVELIRDERHGKAREMLALAIATVPSRGVDDVLIELLDDRDVAGHAIIGLGKRRTKKAVSKIEPFTRSPKAWVRREAAKALGLIAKSQGVEV